MELQDYQIHDVARVKSACQRGLESSIVMLHTKDHQVFEGDDQYRTAFRYLNRPLPQAGLTQQTLHLLHPQIDTSNVFLSEKLFDRDWHYTRQDIPNVLSSEQKVKSYRDDLNQYRKNTDTGSSGDHESSVPVSSGEITETSPHDYVGSEPEDESRGDSITQQSDRSSGADSSHYVWFVVVIMIIILVALCLVLFYGLAKYSKRLNSIHPTVYAHIHPQFIPSGQFPGEN